MQTNGYFNPSPVDAILFDKDGTLFDFHETWRPVLLEAADHASGGNVHLAGQLLAAGGYEAKSGKFLADSVIAAGHSGELAQLWSRLGAIVAQDQLQCYLDEQFVAGGVRYAVPVTDLLKLFQQLTGYGLTLGILTNDSEASVHSIIKHYRLADCVAFVAGYDSGYGAKPQPGMVKAFCDRTGITPQQTIIVGDSNHDMETGRAAGLHACIGVLTGAGTLDSLRAVADLVMPDITCLPELFEKHNSAEHSYSYRR